MNPEEARELSSRPHPGSRSLLCIWHCGLINGEIRKAARLGDRQVSLQYPRDHYVAKHRELFTRLYEGQGYRVSFEPDYKKIRPTRWTLTVSWEEDGPQA